VALIHCRCGRNEVTIAPSYVSWAHHLTRIDTCIYRHNKYLYRHERRGPISHVFDVAGAQVIRLRSSLIARDVLLVFRQCVYLSALHRYPASTPHLTSTKSCGGFRNFSAFTGLQPESRPWHAGDSLPAPPPCAKLSWMLCPSCGQRKARRACPALARTICPMCCGTKRLTEIQCPADCVYLSSAREHPAAVVRRQQARDVSRLLPTIRHLTERQYQLFFLLHSVIARHTPQGLTRLVDGDVEEAARALAATLETAGRGVIYEHTPTAPPAQALTAEIRSMLARIREQGATVYDGETAIVLRAIERGAREVKVSGESDTVYMELIARLLQANGPPPSPTWPAPAGTVIAP